MSPSSLDSAVFGLFSTHALDLAIRHGVFSHLIEQTSADAESIARARGIDADTTERLLLVLAAASVLDRGADGTYRVAPGTVPYVDPASSRYLGEFVSHLVANTAGQLSLLDDYLRRGKAAADVGRPAVFDGIYRDEESTRAFLEAMWQLSYEPSKELVALAQLADVRRLVDVGGASGAFAVAALAEYSGLRAAVFDLPQVAPHLDRVRHDRGLTDRLEFVPGDFFQDELPAADCLSFGYILSDWEDGTCLGLLEKAYRACAPGGRVLVLERLFDEQGGPLPTAVMNLSMHVETQGRHRTGAEYTALLEKAGFTDCSVHRSSWDKHLVIGRKP
ncbi:methyltransferase [Kitasatospora sp. NPDC101183]|uniref:methyltransferase n=1 Tax=Kitasatospora sp. NPDC101183 TaxID=3364100 RepID=UPI003804C764